MLAAALRVSEGAYVSTGRGSTWRPMPDGGGVEALLGRCERLLEEGRLAECAAELEKAVVGWEARRALEELKGCLLRRAGAEQALEGLTAAEALRAMA